MAKRRVIARYQRGSVGVAVSAVGLDDLADRARKAMIAEIHRAMESIVYDAITRFPTATGTAARGFRFRPTPTGGSIANVVPYARYSHRRNRPGNNTEWNRLVVRRVRAIARAAAKDIVAGIKGR